MDPGNPLSIKSMIKFIRTDRKAVIFPEGRITCTGALMKIYEGPGLIADKADAMILPIAIDGAGITPFSYMQGRGHIRWFPQITLRILPPEKLKIPAHVQGHARRQAATLAMQALMFKLPYATVDHRQSIFSALLGASKKFSDKRPVLEDMGRETLNYKQLIMRSLILARAIRNDSGADEHVGMLLPNVNAAVLVFMALQYLARVPTMLNYTAGTQVLIAACQTGKIKTIYSSRRFIAHAGLEQTAAALERNVRLIYLEDIKQRVSPLTKFLGLLMSYCPKTCYQRQSGKVDPQSPAVILFTSGSEGRPKGRGAVA